MSTKPATVPTWATDATLTSGTEAGTAPQLAPSAGYRSQGLVPGNGFNGKVLNYLFGEYQDWLQYLNDGALSGDHTINGNLTITGGLSHAIGSTGGVVSPSFAYGSGLTPAPITRSRTVPIAPLIQGGAATYWYINNTDDSFWTCVTSSKYIFIPIMPAVGCTITQIMAVATPASTGMKVCLVTSDGSGGAWAAAAGGAEGSSSGTTPTNFSWTGSLAVDAGHMYAIRVRSSASLTTSPDLLTGLVVTYSAATPDEVW